jgi:hypothetical protein
VAGAGCYPAGARGASGRRRFFFEYAGQRQQPLSTLGDQVAAREAVLWDG